MSVCEFVCIYVNVCVYNSYSFCLYICMFFLRVDAALYDSTGSYSLELLALCLPSTLPVMPTSILCELDSQQPHCFVLKVHFYFAFKWMEMQIYAVLWVGGETDTGLCCPLREQGAL